MRQFVRKGFRIEQLSTDAKLIYSGFLLLTLAGLVLSVVYYISLVGPAPVEGAKQYYAGAAPAETAEPGIDEAVPELEPADEVGPELDLPEDELDAPTAKLIVPMTVRKLMEVTHFHLFTLPVFLLIVAHLFMLCPMRPRLKTAVLTSATLSLVVHIAAPWIVFEGGPGWAWIMPITGTWMTASMLIMIAWPAWAMWRPRKQRTDAPTRDRTHRANVDVADACPVASPVLTREAR